MIELRRIDFRHDNLHTNSELTIILPVRAMESRNITERLVYVLVDKYLDTDLIDFLIVDDGSNSASSDEMLKICKDNNFSYIYVDTQNKPFSIARARNVGAMYAKSKYIMFMDVDLHPYDGFYDDLLLEIKVQNLDKYANDFIMIPVIYLTEYASNLFFTLDENIRKPWVIQKLIEDDSDIIEKFSSGTSANIYNRISYLSHGGNDEDFEKWGYDDLEFNLRMIRESKKFPFPAEMQLDYKNFRTINEYKGWKSIYRLFGDITFQKGIFLTHIWHHIDHKSDYMKGKEKNRQLFEKKFAAYRDKKLEPTPLPCMNQGKTLIFAKTNPFVYNRKILPYLGIIDYVQEEMFDEKSLVKYIKLNSIDRVLMFNPYGSEQRLKLYKSLRKNNISVLVSERGALRDSVFYDWNGFNAESKSYDEENWNYPLSDKAYNIVDEYILNETNIDISLEKQEKMIGADQLREKLNISADKKVLFVPLQRPSDSVIKYFCGSIGTYADFIMLVKDTIKSLDENWVVVVKKHPLEDEIAEIEGAIYTDANIKDLLEMCDFVLLINSGVGLLSMLWNKPVLYCGEVFYGNDKINRHVTTTKDILNTIEENFLPNKEVVYRFLYYLLENFYSFGTFTTREIPWEDGGRMTVTTGIDFYHIRNISKNGLDFYHDQKVRINRNSILFDRYNCAQKPAAQKPAAQKPAAQKKLKKLKESPNRFFKESKNPLLKGIGRIFW